MALHTRGWLPYTLYWTLEVTASDYPRGFAIAAAGDLEGTGIWTFEQAAHQVIATFDWKVVARKPLLRRGGAILRRIFAANHRWAMRQGEQSLAREITRRRGTVRID